MNARLELDDDLSGLRVSHLVVAEDSPPASEAGLIAAVRLARW